MTSSFANDWLNMPPDKSDWLDLPPDELGEKLAGEHLQLLRDALEEWKEQRMDKATRDAIRARLADFDRLHQMPIHWNGDLFDSDGDGVVLVKARYLSPEDNASVAAAILHVSDDIRTLLKQHDADQKRIAELKAAIRPLENALIVALDGAYDARKAPGECE